MPFDESLYVTANFTTPRGKKLAKQSNALTIKDTSNSPTYTAGFFTDNLANTPMSSVNEGGTAYIVLTTTGVPDFTYLDWEITGAGITLDDTGASTMSGQAMIRTNKYWATIKPKLDLLTEGNETLIITFKRDGVVVASASIVINDTSNGSILNEDVTLFYSETQMQGGNWTRYDAGYKSIDGNIVFNGESYPDDSTLWTVDSVLMIPSNSPMRSVFDRYNRVEFNFLVTTGQTVTINYNYHTVFEGTRQYRNDQYPNLNGFEFKIKPYAGKTAKMSVKLYN